LFFPKKGYGGEDNPKFVSPSIMGIIDDALEMDIEDASQHRSKRILVGEKATRIRKDHLEISDIIWNGVCKNISTKLISYFIHYFQNN
jgi:hypothetical protein